MKRLVLTAKKTFIAGFVPIVVFLSATPLLAQVPGAETGGMLRARAAHTATLLGDGKILIVGGENQDGLVVESEIFDPATGLFTPGPPSILPRSDHAATLLPDGRVLVTGGTSGDTLLDSTEIFDPATGLFSPGPTMTQPRKGHTATAFPDNSILLAGGDAEGDAEIYDPATNRFVSANALMGAPRFFHSAVLLANGEVLIAGGVGTDGAPLDSTEIFDPQAMGFFLVTDPMGIARSLPVLRVLPDGKVQVIGGDEENTMEVFDPDYAVFNGLVHLPPSLDLLDATLKTTSRAALLNPTVMQRPELTGILSDPVYRLLLDRTAYSITEIPQSYQALVSGGANSDNQVLNSAFLLISSPATVTTDRTDYAPGEIVTVTGGGWLPGETVMLLFHEDPEMNPDMTAFAVADPQGNFTNADFSPIPDYIGKKFTLTAIGPISGFTAQTTFSDAPKVGSVTVGAQSPNPVTPGNSATYTITVNRGSGPGSSGAFTATLSITTALPTGAGSSFSPNPVSFTPSQDSRTSTLTISTSLTTPGGTPSFTVKASTSANDFATGDGTLSICVPPSITAHPSSATKVYGDSVTFSVTAAGTLPLTYQWRKNRGNIGSATNSSYSIPSVLLVDAGDYDVVVTGPGSCGSVTSNAATLIVNKRPASVTPNAASKTYGDADPSFTGTLTGFLVADGVTATYSRTTGDTVAGSPYTISATLSPAGVLGNYDITYNTALFTINKKAASVTPDAASKTYGDADPSFTGTLTGFLVADGVTATYSRTTGDTVAGSPYTISAVLAPAGVLGNYDITYNTANFTISKAMLTVTAVHKTKILNAPNPPFTFQIIGYKYGETSAVLTTQPTCTSTATQTSPVGPYPITCDGGAANNYDFTYIAATLKVEYQSTGLCNGDPGHEILRPIDSEGLSVFKQGSTVPAKFRVCDANGTSIGNIGVVESFKLIRTISGINTVEDPQEVESTTPNTAFRWSSTDQQWIFNMSTKNKSIYKANTTYVFQITLNDGSWIDFQYGLK